MTSMSMTWTDYIRYAQGYRIRLARSFEVARMISHTTILVNTQKGKPVPKPEKIWPLITDPAPEIIKPLSLKDLQALKKRYTEQWQLKKA